MGGGLSKVFEDNERVKFQKMTGAVRIGDLDKIRRLHDNGGVNVKGRDKDGYNLAWYAMYHEKIDSLIVLKELGLDLTEPCDLQECTPLAWAKDRYGVASPMATGLQKLLIEPPRFSASEKIMLENGFFPPDHRTQGTDFVLLNMN
jgi:hypothetical protein